MKRKLFSLLIASALSCPALPCPAAPPAPAADRPVTIDEAYRLALARSEGLAQSAEAVVEALARVDELKSSVMPHLFLNASEIWQQSPNIKGSPVNITSVPSIALTLEQPLFSGFREFLAFKAGKKRAQSGELDKRRAETLLYRDVAQAYLELLRLQNEFAIRRALIDATRERVEQLLSWIKIGRSRESEGLSARSQLAQLQALFEIARGQETMAQEALRFLTGIDERLAPQPPPVPNLEPLEPYLEKAKNRPDVQARQKDLESAELFTEMSRRQRWPTIGATGNYYLKRSGFQQNIHYDAVFTASLPIFQSGLIGAQVRQARARERAGVQALSRALRAAENEVRSDYRNLEWNLAAAAALGRAVELAQANVKAQAEDYKLSLVTNLEVLDSLNALQNARLVLNQTQQQAVLAKIRLEVAAGGPPAPGEAR